MKVTFRQSGGVAGLLRGCEVDTATLPEKESAELESLTRKVASARAVPPSQRGARDVCLYEIKIEDGRETKSLSFDDLNVPEEIEPLLLFLQRRAKPRSLK